MSIFDPSKLSVKFMAPATRFRPIDGRKYTLTHSDQTGELFLSIGNEYDYSSINKYFRDEVIAEWQPQMGEFTLYGKVYVDAGEFDENYSSIRYMIFKKELQLTLSAIIYGDQILFSYFPWLLDAPIYIQFESAYPAYSQVIYYGTPRRYLTGAMQTTTI